MPTGRSGFVRGRVYAQNLQSGSASSTLGGTGTDVIGVTFARAFEKVPKVVVERTSSDVTTNYVSNKTLTGFHIHVSSTSLTTTPTYDWIALDDSYQE